MSEQSCECFICFFSQQEFIELLLHVRYGAGETKMTKIVLVTSKFPG